MKIYFSATKFHIEKDIPTYRRIIQLLEKNGHEVYNKVLSTEQTDATHTTSNQLKQWYEEWSSYIQNCDFALMEASYPSSVHVGFEIGMSLMRGKPVVVLYKNPMDPIFVNSLFTPRLIKSEYTDTTLEESLRWAIDEVKNSVNRRFTFFISPEIDVFLDEVTKKDGVTRSEYIRKLIEGKIMQDQ